MATNGTTTINVSGKTAIVTGAGSGINFEFAKLLLAKNCNVILADISFRPEARALVESHPSKPRAFLAKTDVRDWDQLAALFALANTTFGGADLVCPGAGVFEPPSSNFWQPPGAPGSASTDSPHGVGHYATLDINLLHPIRATQLAISHFLNPPEGRAPASPGNPKAVVHVSSVAGELAMLSEPMYVASKWGIAGFVRSFEALEPQTGIRVSAVAPGLVRTPLWTDAPGKLRYVDEAVDKWVAPQEVAVAMLKVVEDPALPGGTVLEVGYKHTRVIPMLNNPGPSGEGFAVANISTGVADAFERLGRKGWGTMS